LRGRRPASPRAVPVGDSNLPPGRACLTRNVFRRRTGQGRAPAGLSRWVPGTAEEERITRHPRPPRQRFAEGSRASTGRSSSLGPASSAASVLSTGLPSRLPRVCMPSESCRAHRT
jgi:hypothetical protein